MPDAAPVMTAVWPVSFNQAADAMVNGHVMGGVVGMIVTTVTTPVPFPGTSPQDTKRVGR